MLRAICFLIGAMMLYMGCGFVYAILDLFSDAHKGIHFFLVLILALPGLWLLACGWFLVRVYLSKSKSSSVSCRLE